MLVGTEETQMPAVVAVHQQAGSVTNSEPGSSLDDSSASTESTQPSAHSLDSAANLMKIIGKDYVDTKLFRIMKFGNYHEREMSNIVTTKMMEHCTTNCPNPYDLTKDKLKETYNRKVHPHIMDKYKDWQRVKRRTVKSSMENIVIRE